MCKSLTGSICEFLRFESLENFCVAHVSQILLNECAEGPVLGSARPASGPCPVFSQQQRGQTDVVNVLNGRS